MASTPRPDLRERSLRLLRDCIGVVGDEIQALERVPWSRLKVFSRTHVLVLANVVIVGVALVVFFLAFPQAVASSATGGLLGRFLFAQLLVQLLWMTFTWFAVALIVPVIGGVLRGQHLLAGTSEILRSIPNLATWTGRVTMPVVLASLAAGVAGFPTSASNGRSVITSVGGIQLGMLFVALLIVLTVESVGVVWRSSSILPPMSRFGLAALFPFLAWTGARTIWPQYPLTASLLRSLAPEALDSAGRARWAGETLSAVLHVPIGLGLLAFTCSCVLLAIVRGMRAHVSGESATAVTSGTPGSGHSTTAFDGAVSGTRF